MERDVVIVGAGPAGIGVAVALMDADVTSLLVLERHVVGASFAMWPKETRFITPSFPTNSVGMLDINSIAIGVSPGFSMRREHPTGAQYAEHLSEVAEFFEVPIQENVDVTEVVRDGEFFRVETSQGTVHARHVIWAAGEFQYPRVFAFPGAPLCRHTASVGTYQDLDGDDFVIIGGYESGLDAAYHLALRNKRVRLIDRACPWSEDNSDPSISLSPYSLERMEDPRFQEKVELMPNTRVSQVDEVDGGFRVVTEDGQHIDTSAQPLLAVGFVGSHGLVADLFEARDDGYPLLNDRDESTKVPGVFLCGPAVRHGDQVFCFIYKYRQRFAVVAKAIATSLGLPAEDLEEYRDWGMYLDDLTICGQDCVC